MNLAAMRTKFRTSANDLDADDSDATIDDYLNAAYRYAVPADVSGLQSEGTWQLTCTIGDGDEDLPDYVLGPDQDTAWFNSYDDGAGGTASTGLYYLTIMRDPAKFQHYKDWTTNAQPTRVLVYGRTIEFDRSPDLGYIVNFPVRMGPSAALTGDGLDNEAHARAVVYSALMDYHADSQDESSRILAEREYERWKSRLLTATHTAGGTRRPARSF